MTPSDKGAVLHLAGEPEGLVQKCSRCGYVLSDYNNAMGVGAWSPSWWEGEITVWEGNPTHLQAGRHDNAIECNARPQ